MINYSKYGLSSLYFTLKTMNIVFSTNSTAVDLSRGHIEKWHLSSIMALIKTQVIAE